MSSIVYSNKFLIWSKKNLFSSWINTLLTVLSIYFIYEVSVFFLDWAVFKADFLTNFRGERIIDRTFCSKNIEPGSYGACWAIIHVRFYQFMYGFYPAAEVWRVNLVFFLLPFALVAIFFDKVPFRKYLLYFTLAFPFIAFYLLYGGPSLTTVGTNKWGGLLVTLFLGVTGIALAFPLSIALALGRRSNMPIISLLCVIFIEFIRGVPLITLLFTANVMLPLFLPDGVSPDNLLRALVAVTLFQSAYMAEAIRGGLQAIPRGQIEAARSMGLTYWQSTRKIVLPQALRISIPPIVNTSIGLFKDTSLVLIIGLFDLLGIGRAALADMTWTKLYYEVYVFVAIVFFIFCFAMSRYSLYLEKKLKTDNSS
ncbi:MAG: amino acid ABC transporter permease [Pelagibacteraceae bacterium]|nr:amino acid ABC transporter permease [Pelagibacteraceae bacterium]|tara:strand:+ start:296 stop:1399 length:1104 start_codon:yes stop_codon:yes gene_type:complete